MDRSVIYYILHVSSAFMLFLAYGALLGRAMLADAVTPEAQAKLRKFGSIVSGIALVLLAVGGFGLMARLGYSFDQPWLWVKIACWLGLGAMTALINKQPKLAGIWFWLTWALGLLAVLAVYLFRFL